MNVFKLSDYHHKINCYMKVNIYEPHGNHKLKAYNKYTKNKEKGPQMQQ